MNSLPFIIILMIVCCALNNKLLYKESFDYGEEEFKNKIQSIRDKEAYEMNELIKTGIDKCITEKTTSELNDMITNIEEEYKQLTLYNHELELQCSMISKDVEMENLISTELSNKKVELTRLLDKEKMLKLSLAKLEEASGEIRKRIVPEFEKCIGEALSLITNDKYKSIKYVNDKGLIVKNQLGNNVSTHSLSVGTVDQIYIAFRLALCKKYEDIPIVFDESFTYADDERLCEILKNINMLSANKQIIIISCTTREEKIMDENQIKYHKINI